MSPEMKKAIEAREAYCLICGKPLLSLTELLACPLDHAAIHRSCETGLTDCPEEGCAHALASPEEVGRFIAGAETLVEPLFSKSETSRLSAGELKKHLYKERGLSESEAQPTEARGQAAATRVANPQTFVPEGMDVTEDGPPTKNEPSDPGFERGMALWRQAVGGELLEAGFELEKPYGSGGMGRVFLGRKTATGTPAIIKIMPRMVTRDPLWKRVDREVAAMRAVTHPNIVKMLGSGTVWESGHGLPRTVGRRWIALEFIDGLTLQQKVRKSLRENRKPLEAKEVVPIFRDLALALEACHEQGLLHRDVKPSNIVLRKDSGAPVLIDFGLARADRSSPGAPSSFAESITQAGQLVGTPLFAAPEQLLGRKLALGRPTDVWGFGVTLFYCLSGRYPYDAGNIDELIEAVGEGKPAQLRTLNKEVPEWLAELCHTCFSVAPGERPDLEDIVNRLQKGDQGWGKVMKWLGM